MNYQDERTYGCRVSDSWHYRGMKTVIIENKYIRVQIIADKGADISSFIYKPTDTEIMFKTPWGIRNPSLTIPSSGDPASVWLIIMKEVGKQFCLTEVIRVIIMVLILVFMVM